MMSAHLTVPMQCHTLFFNDPSTTQIYTLSLHDALPILKSLPTILRLVTLSSTPLFSILPAFTQGGWTMAARSEEHTSELQSRQYLVCRLLLEKKKKRS